MNSHSTIVNYHAEIEPTGEGEMGKILVRHTNVILERLLIIIYLFIHLIH